MPIEFFERDVGTERVIAALKRDGAVVVRNQVPDELADRVLAELRESFDTVGRYDENDFNGYKTLRISSILAVSRTSGRSVSSRIMSGPAIT